MKHPDVWPLVYHLLYWMQRTCKEL